MSETIKETIEIEVEDAIGIVKRSVIIGLRKPTEDDAIVRDCVMYPGLQEYLLMLVDMPGKEMLARGMPKNELLGKIGITLDEAWEAAERNTAADVEATFVEDSIKQMAGEIGIPIPDIAQIGVGTPFIVVTNSCQQYGAGAALCCRDRIGEISKSVGCRRWFAIPSSEHEFLFIADTGDFSLDWLVGLMNEVDGEIGTDEHLIDKVFYMEL